MHKADPALWSDEDRHWMQQALQLAKQAGDLGEVPVGAVVVREAMCLGQGMNAPIASHDPTHHAELAAIRAAAQNAQNYRLPGATLYVTLEPCTQCFGALIHARIARVVFAAKEPRAGVLGSKLALHEADFYNHHLSVEHGLYAEESAELLRGFFQARRGQAPHF